MQQQPPRVPVGEGKYEEVAGKHTAPLAFLVYICTKSVLISLPGQLGHEEERGDNKHTSHLHIHILLWKTFPSLKSLLPFL